jgi:hypothetical protein
MSNSTSRDQSFYTFRSKLTTNKLYVIVAGGNLSLDGYFPSRPFNLSVFENVRASAANPLNTDVLFINGSTDSPGLNLIDISDPRVSLATNVTYTSHVTKYFTLRNRDYKINVTRNTAALSLSIAAPTSMIVASSYLPVATSGLQGQAVTLVASGFEVPKRNKNGPQFGLFIAMPSGGDLIPLQTFNLNNNNIQNIKMYPNPASSVLNIEIPFEHRVTSAKVMDANGREMMKIDNLNGQIDTSKLSNGIYVINLNIDNTNYTTKFFITK